jgi:phenylalanyl-tRNA synthetase beta chain
MRTSLVPGLLSTLNANSLHGERDLKLFEWGKVFIYEEGQELPRENLAMAAVMTGLQQPKEWYSEEREVDFFDIKGTVEGLLTALGLDGIRFQKGDASPWYAPTGSSGIYLSGSKIGMVGLLLPDVQEMYDLKREHVFLFELDIQGLMGKITKRKRFVPYVRFPAVMRDISLVVERPTESVKVLEIIEREGDDLVESVKLYDFYQGEKVGSTEKALAFRICYRSKERTLDGKEVNELHDHIIQKIMHETGGRLRES